VFDRIKAADSLLDISGQHTQNLTIKPKDIFGLAVRILGLVILYHLLLALPAIVPVFSGRIDSIFFALVALAAALAVIWWLIGGAPLLTNRAYPEQCSDKAKQGEEADA
jgi:hypothetical protein